MAKALMSGEVPPEVAAARLSICKDCQLAEAGSDIRLFREVDGSLYCGEPRVGWKVYRDEAAIGCGCKLEEKVKHKASACPHARWVEHVENQS